MESKTPISDEIPTALPGFEEDDAREKLLLETTEEDQDGEADDEDLAFGDETVEPKTRRWQILRTLAGFAVFVCILAVAVSWFFGMGSFSEQEPQPVSRNAQKDTPTSPAAEDEKLKMALSMVAERSPVSGSLDDPLALEEEAAVSGKPRAATDFSGDISTSKPDQIDPVSLDDRPQYSLPSVNPNAAKNNIAPAAAAPEMVREKAPNISAGNKDVSDEARGRSLFFGISKKPVQTAESHKIADAAVNKTVLPEATLARAIPFGTLLPVRLVGSIYTFRNSGGFVRMELTRPVEGEGFLYPAGTTVIGNVRGGESVRAFVTIIGLIDPISGELVRFGGELLGRDGGSGIEGRRRRLTSQWSRFFSSLKETASTVLGSVGAIRSGSTVVLSEPIRRGSESMSEDLSDALLKNGKDNTFIEVSAGANGYVLVTTLPENASAGPKEVGPEAGGR
ncbi:MAG TPA: hypothetical protein PKD24_16985 [Pyrinomonadaceae bacterium]|nr:hypothetical protein [Pyrinomonadaceae bacterium]HMP67094.1 hypothetical protein [Pyrinomonadaceae bacterium]